MLWITPLFWLFLSTKQPFEPLFFLLCDSGIFIKKNVIHNLINIFL